MIGNTDNGLILVVCERSDRVSWSYFPFVVDRVVAFCEAYESDADPTILVETMTANFAMQKPSMIAIALATPQGLLAGHILVQIEDWMGVRKATIIQLEVDKEYALKPEVVTPAYEWILWWAKECGAKELQCLARNDAVARLFRQRYGFESKRILMRKSLATDSENIVKFPASNAENH